MRRKLQGTRTTKTTANMCNVAWKKGSFADHLLASWLCLFLAALVLISCSTCTFAADPLKVIYAVNAGGEEHTDRNGIQYDADPLKGIGIASDYGKHLLMIGRVQEQDEVLYRTERYHTTTFGYDLPSDGDGDYALIMKFCEVYFDAPQKKVFDVLLNRKHTVVRQLDIYDQVGRGSAHDEIVYFKINNGRLNYEGEVSDVRNGRLRLDFIKGALDNPKINAFALLKGDVSQVPRLHGTEASERMKPELGNSNSKQIVDQKQPGHQPERVVRAQRDDVDEDDEDLDDEEFGEELPDQLRDSGEHNDNSQSQPTDSKKSYSGPRQPNPYSMDDSSILLPVFIAIGAFIPLLFCLCKL
ncbi:malectin [Drosophila kikkawai]|uniref:Malectin n=1 Tax=Drosophila kikkawai TaxID=30033 RepID=A0A6P4J9H2_DROKI|nr:malectin [Drosophila kikkawai]